MKYYNKENTDQVITLAEYGGLVTQRVAELIGDASAFIQWAHCAGMFAQNMFYRDANKLYRQQAFQQAAAELAEQWEIVTYVSSVICPHSRSIVDTPYFDQPTAQLSAGLEVKRLTSQDIDAFGIVYMAHNGRTVWRD